MKHISCKGHRDPKTLVTTVILDVPVIVRSTPFRMQAWISLSLYDHISRSFIPGQVGGPQHLSLFYITCLDILDPQYVALTNSTAARRGISSQEIRL